MNESCTAENLQASDHALAQMGSSEPLSMAVSLVQLSVKEHADCHNEAILAVSLWQKSCCKLCLDAFPAKEILECFIDKFATTIRKNDSGFLAKLVLHSAHVIYNTIFGLGLVFQLI